MEPPSICLVCGVVCVLAALGSPRLPHPGGTILVLPGAGLRKWHPTERLPLEEVKGEAVRVAWACSSGVLVHRGPRSLTLLCPGFLSLLSFL